MDDNQKHLIEYERYEKELIKLIPKETIQQQKYWFENRLKSVRNRIRDTKIEMEKNG